MYCGAGTGCWARRATAGVGWFACPGVSRAPKIIKGKTSKQAFAIELRRCIARSPVEEFFAANQAGGSQDSVIKRAQKTSWRKELGVGCWVLGVGVGGLDRAYVPGWMFLRTPQ